MSGKLPKERKHHRVLLNNSIYNTVNYLSILATATQVETVVYVTLVDVMAFMQGPSVRLVALLMRILFLRSEQRVGYLMIRELTNSI